MVESADSPRTRPQEGELDAEVVRRERTAPRRVVRHGRPFPEVSSNAYHQADTVAMPRTSRGHRHLLIVVDVGSRYLAAIPLTALITREVAAKLRRLYEENHAAGLRPPDVWQSDGGSEFKREVTALVTSWKGPYGNPTRKMVSPARAHTYQAFVERSALTLSTRLFAYIQYEEEKRRDAGTLKRKEDFNDWDEALPALLKWYNQRPHSVTRIPPAEAILMSPIALAQKKAGGRPHKPLPEAERTRPVLKPGTKVLISLQTRRPERGTRATDVRWSREVYTIASAMPATDVEATGYRVKNAAGVLHRELLYRDDLRPV